MNNKIISLAIIPFAAFISSCQGQASEAETAFVAECNKSVGENRPKLCGCIFTELKDKFSEEQMTRISGIFKTNVPNSVKALRQSGTESDIDIVSRIEVVEIAAEGCFKKLKS